VQERTVGFRQGAEPLDSDAMAKEFSMEFANVVFTRGQEVAFRYPQKNKIYQLKLMVKALEGTTVNSDVSEGSGSVGPCVIWRWVVVLGPSQIFCGPLNVNAAIVFDKAEGSPMSLVGRSKGYVLVPNSGATSNSSLASGSRRIIPSSTLSGTSRRWASVDWTGSSPTFSDALSPREFSLRSLLSKLGRRLITTTYSVHYVRSIFHFLLQR